MAGHMPPGKLSGITLGGIGEPVRNFQLIALAPFWMTVKITHTSGIRTSAKAAHMTTVAIWFLVRRQPLVSRRSTAPGGGETAAIRRSPYSDGPSASRSRGRPG